MESFVTALIGTGGLLVIVNLLAGILELATIRTIRPPEHRTFTYIRLAANQNQTIFAPALGALVSGLLVSISASFFYEGLRFSEPFWYRYAGVASFFAAGFALVVTLRSAIKGVGDPSELANDPFTIRAAAEEYSEDARRATLSPEFLEKRLSQWERDLPGHSLNISRKSDAKRVLGVLDKAAATTGLLRSTRASSSVYMAALAEFPLRFV